MKQSRSLVKASSRSSGVPGGRRLAGLLLLAAGVAASLVLVWQHLQGRGDPAWDGSRVGSWEGSIGGWPHSFLSLAYFIGLAAAWFPSSKGKVPASFRYLVRLGGLASAGLLLLVFLGGGEQWGWLLAAHGANLVFWSLVEWGPGSRDFSWRALAPFVAGFGLVSGMLLVLDTDRRQDLGDRTERTAPESPLAGSAQAGGGTGPENPASPAGGKVHGEEGSSPGPVQEPTEPDTFPALKQRLLAATVRIVMVPEGAQGTGTIIDASPPLVYVLTACHVVEGAQRLDVFTFPESPAAGQGQGPWSGEVIARAKASDLALVRLVGRGVRVAPVRVCPPSLVPGFMPFPVLTAGCDGGGAPSCQTDILRGKVRAARWDGESAALYWEALHPPAAGRSGGAIVGRQGYLLGVCSGSYNHKGYYVSLEEIDRFLKDNGFGFLLEQNGK